MNGMSLQDQEKMSWPSRTPGFCIVCGRSYHWAGVHYHHVVPRSRGGHEGPCVQLCSACHGDVHASALHLTYNEAHGAYYYRSCSGHPWTVCKGE